MLLQQSNDTLESSEIYNSQLCRIVLEAHGVGV